MEWIGKFQWVYAWIAPIAVLCLVVWGLCIKFGAPSPPIGTYIAVLAFAGIVVTIWPPASSIEKAAWILVFLFLMVFEIWNLYKDRAEHDKQQALLLSEARDQFKAIASGVTTSLDRLGILARLSEDSIAEMVGGKSMCYVEIRGTFIGGPLTAYLLGKGKHPLSSLTVRIIDFDRSTTPIEGLTWSIPEQRRYAGYATDLTKFQLGQDVKEKRYTAVLSALNGTFIEWIYLYRVGESWKVALQVIANYSDGTNGRVLETVDEGFPAESLQADKQWMYYHNIKFVHIDWDK